MSVDSDLERRAAELVRERERMGSGTVIGRRLDHLCELPDNQLADEWPEGTRWRCALCRSVYVKRARHRGYSSLYSSGWLRDPFFGLRGYAAVVAVVLLAVLLGFFVAWGWLALVGVAVAGKVLAIYGPWPYVKQIRDGAPTAYSSGRVL